MNARRLMSVIGSAICSVGWLLWASAKTMRHEYGRLLKGRQSSLAAS